MFGVDTSELLVVAVIALLFIGPKDLPRVMMQVGRWVGKARGYARHFTSGVENVIREAELDEMEKKWREENQKILAAYPADAHYPEPVPAGTEGPVLSGVEGPVMTALPPASDDQPALPFEMAPIEAPAAPDDDPTPPAERPLP
ncbi:MAG: Sec-independent protein translocase protein TatB [Sphingomonas bacterium]|nr:Sec-independent protein translocase protein TatB [Sphingomonas bacterium]